MKNVCMMTRRQFVKLGSMTAAACLIGIDIAGDAYAAAASFFSRRLASVYTRDAQMPVRKSQDNPSVKRLYAEFLGHPLSEKAEKLLHTEYIVRVKPGHQAA